MQYWSIKAQRNKMKASELRIGNLIYWNIPNKMERKIVHEVSAIINPTLHTCPISLGILDEDGYVGIPLTEEWLLKFGFENQQIELDYPDKLLINSATVGGKYYFYLDDTDGSTFYLNYIQYVHQLQNLYFILTGTELEIK